LQKIWVLMCVVLMALTAGCRATGSVAEPMGQIFDGDRSTSEVSAFSANLAAVLGDPDETIVMIYNHGTDWGGKFQDCEPETMPNFLKYWSEHGIQGQDVVVFYLCAQVAEDFAAMGSARSRENEEVLDRLLAAGVPARNIFIVGHSGGASTALLTSNRASEKFNSAIVSAPGYGFAWLKAEGEGGNWINVEYDKWRSPLARADDMSAYVLLYEGDLWAPPGDATFLARHPLVELVTVRDDDQDGVLCKGLDEPHFYWWTACFARGELPDVERFVIDRLGSRSWGS
jgi:pimeloyl-ACP methyl ester carboxylesterase